MDFKNEQFKLGRLIGYAERLSANRINEYLSLKEYIQELNEWNEFNEVELKDEYLIDIIGVYCCNSTLFEYDGMTYCLSTVFEDDDDNDDDMKGIVYLKDNKLCLVDNPKELLLISGECD